MPKPLNKPKPKVRKKSNDLDLDHYEVWAFFHGFNTSLPLPSVSVTTLCGKCNFTYIFFLL